MWRLIVGQAVDEGGVGAVLEQAAHEVGDEVVVAADRRVDAAVGIDAAAADHLVVQRLAHAVQALQLERRPPAATQAEAIEWALCVANCGNSARLVGQHQLDAGEIGHVGVDLAREDRVVVEARAPAPT